MKLCTECTHCVIPTTGVSYARCENPAFGFPSPVDGGMYWTTEYALHQRTHSSGQCGLDAKGFEQKVTP